MAAKKLSDGFMSSPPPIGDDGDANSKKRKASARGSMEDGEKAKKKKDQAECDMSLNSEEDNDVVEANEEEKEKEQMVDDDIQVVRENPQLEATSSRNPQKDKEKEKGRPSNVLSSSGGELEWAYKSIKELHNMKGGNDNDFLGFIKATNIATELMKRLTAANDRAGKAEKELSVVRSSETNWRDIAERRGVRISELFDEVNSLKAQLGPAIAARPAPRAHRIEPIEHIMAKADNERLKKDVKRERKHREEAEDELRNLKLSIQKGGNETLQVDSHVHSSVGSRAQREKGSAIELKKQLEDSRQSNEAANKALNTALAELEQKNGKIMMLEEQVRDQPAADADTKEELETLKKRSALLMTDNMELHKYKKAREGKEGPDRVKNGAILKQRDELVVENRELKAKVEEYERRCQLQGTNGFHPMGVPLRPPPPPPPLPPLAVAPPGFFYPPPPPMPHPSFLSFPPPYPYPRPPSSSSSFSSSSESLSNVRPTVPPRFPTSHGKQ